MTNIRSFGSCTADRNDSTDAALFRSGTYKDIQSRPDVYEAPTRERSACGEKNDEARMNKPTFYALVIIDESGEERFGGAYVDRQHAEEKGKLCGKSFEIRPAYID